MIHLFYLHLHIRIWSGVDEFKIFVPSIADGGLLKYNKQSWKNENVQKKGFDHLVFFKASKMRLNPKADWKSLNRIEIVSSSFGIS